MPRGKSYSYVVDGLTSEKGEIIAKGLRALSDVFEVAVLPNRGVVRVRARKDVEDQVRLACDIARTRFRTKVK